ncbi:MAG: carboxylating nicotinate-nucleotide diphosphorylase [Thermoplasmatota archaeon]
MDWISLYLDEDLGRDGDITSSSLFRDASATGEARLVARERCYVVGANHAADVFERCGASASVQADDAWVDAGEVILSISGPTTAILKGERLALNLLARMSGIGTQTRVLVEALAEACSTCLVAGTRKTTPGFRLFEKEAIARAGGDPHRFGLFDEGMIKDNHREAAGDLAAAIHAFQTAWPDRKLTVEVESLEDAVLAATAGATWVMIDNQSPETGQEWAKAIWDANPATKVEASGGIGPENLLDYAWADRVSMGALTHQAQSVDLALDWGAK